jgi:DNA-binding GntR family transcriptional regulator
MTSPRTGDRDDEIERRGLREQVYESVLRRLLDGRLAPGQRLSIEDVARTLQVSPTPVREAFVMLERTQLISRVPQRGYRVAPPLEAERLSELFDARLLLEEHAARSAHAHREQLIDQLRGSPPSMNVSPRSSPTATPALRCPST